MQYTTGSNFEHSAWQMRSRKLHKVLLDPYDLPVKKTHSSLLENTTYKPMVQTWALTKMAVTFANTFVVKDETKLLHQKEFKPLVWKRFIEDISSFWTINRQEIMSE